MSNAAINAVRESSIRPSGRKFVAMALADYADEAWQCFPSVKLLARYTAQGEKTVRDHLAALEAETIIVRTRPRKDDGTLAGYRYQIQWRNLPVAEIASGEKQPEPAAKSAAQEPPKITPNLSGKGRAKLLSPLPDDWTPRPEELDLAKQLKFTEEEISHVVTDFRAYWGDRAHLKSGCHSNWDRTFNNRLRDLSARWGTVRRTASGGKPGGQRRGGVALADAAAWMLSEAE